MTDIDKCEGQNCPIKETCWRFTAPVEFHQFYGEFKYNEGKKECKHFWDNTDYPQVKK